MNEGGHYEETVKYEKNKRMGKGNHYSVAASREQVVVDLEGSYKF